MHRITVPIKGMHCRSCELLIEEQLKEISGVKNAKVSLKHREAEIFSKRRISSERIAHAVEEAGYEVGIDEKKFWFSRNPAEYKDLALALVALALLYYLAKAIGLSTVSVGSESGPKSLPIVFLIGLTAGISTCMALVGGLVLGIAARHAEKHPEATPLQNFRPHVFFNLGRIASYFILGGLIGLIGKAFEISAPVLGVLIMGVGLVMLVLGIQLTEISPRFAALSVTLPSRIGKWFGIKEHHKKEYSHRNSMLVGALTFFLPCGFTQAMQLYAMSTGSFISGALIMSVFALGTAPGLLGVGGLTSIVKGAFAKKFFKFAGLLVIFLAFFNITNGYNLTGWKKISLWPTPSAVQTDSSAVTMEGGKQVVRMKQKVFGYEPNEFVIKKGIPVKWIINSENSNTCAASLVVPKLGTRKFLQPGENVIEFTAEEAGDLRFSCSMGMYTGRFKVMEGSATPSSKADDPLGEEPIPFMPAIPNAARVVSGSVQEDAEGVQQIKTTYYSWSIDISPNTFSVKAGKPVHFEVDVKENGFGCMSTIMVPGLANQPVYLEKGKTIAFDFTPKEKGTYSITCAMGMPRGTITVE